MNPVVYISSFFISMSAGLIGILVVYQLSNKFRFNYLSSYLYYQIFVVIFLLFSFWEQGFLYVILGGKIFFPFSVEKMNYFLAFFSFPFFILLEYMWIKFCQELVEKKLSAIFTTVYFFLQIVLITIFAYLLAQYSNYETGQFPNLFSLFILICFIIDVLAFTIGISQLLIFNVKVTNRMKRKVVKNLAYIYIIMQCIFSAYMIFITSKDFNQLSANFSVAKMPNSAETLFYAFLYVNELVPIFYLRFYLNKYGRTSIFNVLTEAFVRKIFNHYQISKREGEIVRAICEGKSNKQIADELFISLLTVKDHIYNIYQKTGVKNRVQLSNLIRDFRAENPAD